ncbi:MAG: AAA family ATPase [Bacteroidales bacterium]|nr:AAA family ATPase [Bacteroidales bacterium]
MKSEQVRKLLLSQFPYSPTSGQEELIGRLADFLVKEDPGSLFMLKGYAGTGKTTVISVLVKVLPLLHRRSVLLAPTGRAAKVLAGYSSHPAHTIHRKIYFARTTPEGSLVLSLQENQHRNTLFIVDEASMIQNDTATGDFSLFSPRNLLDDLFNYVNKGENCRLILVGDLAQLPPVGQVMSQALDPGYLDKTYHTSTELFELTEVVRQSRDSGILHNATQLRQKITGNIPSVPFFSLSGFNDIRRIHSMEMEDLLHQGYATTGRTDTVVITRSNKRANIYNREIRRRILYFENELAAGELLMVVRNNYFWLPPDSEAGFIANGDIIEILKIRNIQEMYGYRFADVTVRMIDYPDQKEFDTRLLLDTLYVEAASLSIQDGAKLFQTILEDYADLPRRKQRIEKVRNDPYYNALQVKYAYALTCHKTQGGQWKWVFVDQGFVRDDIPDVEYMRWLYTALTRATEKLFLVGFGEGYFF